MRASIAAPASWADRATGPDWDGPVSTLSVHWRPSSSASALQTWLRSRATAARSQVAATGPGWRGRRALRISSVTAASSRSTPATRLSSPEASASRRRPVSGPGAHHRHVLVAGRDRGVELPGALAVLAEGELPLPSQRESLLVVFGGVADSGPVRQP